MRIRLLNPSIYGTEQSGTYDPMHDPKRYPVVVEAAKREAPFDGAAKVPYTELDRVFPIVFSWGEHFRRASQGGETGLSWWNDPAGSEAPKVSWEEVSPFDYWNKLKSSRAVGDVVQAGYL